MNVRAEHAKNSTKTAPVITNRSAANIALPHEVSRETSTTEVVATLRILVTSTVVNEVVREKESFPRHVREVREIDTSRGE